MADPVALQEAIQRARQLAAKITQNQPVKRSAGPSEISGPVKVTLAYEKPTNSGDNNNSKSHNQTSHQRRSRSRSSSRDYNRNERESRDYKDSREGAHNRGSSREYDRNSTHSSTNLLPNSVSHHGNERFESSGPPVPRIGEEKIEIIIPHSVIGLVIGKGGENIKRIQNESGAIVRVDPNTIDERGNKLCTITGTKSAVEEARVQVENVIENSGQNKRPRLQTESSDSYRMVIPASRTGAIIGKGGETIKSIKQQSGCDIELDKSAKECGPDESVFIIRGTQDKISKARSLIEARLASRGRDGGGGGGGRDYSSDHQSQRSQPKGVATGANAAPVGQFNDMPMSFPAGGQQNPDYNAAWLAYYAQYSSYVNQAGTQPAGAAMPVPGQPSLLGSVSNNTPTAAPVTNQQMPQLDQQQPPMGTNQGNSAGQTGQDYSDQWIEYYLANGRPDYAEQIIQMKRQQQAQK